MLLTNGAYAVFFVYCTLKLYRYHFFNFDTIFTKYRDIDIK